MKIASYFKAILSVCALGLILTGCQSSRTEFGSPGVAGATDDAAKGFERIVPGSEEHLIILVGRRVYFSAKSSKLDGVARETLDIQAAWLQQYPTWLIKLQGHADDTGSEAKDIALSAKRAKVVMDYLAQKGVDPNRMWSKGYGVERLVRNCKKLECKALNRRVVVNLRKTYDGAAPQFKKAGS